MGIRKSTFVSRRLKLATLLQFSNSNICDESQPDDLLFEESSRDHIEEMRLNVVIYIVTILDRAVRSVLVL